MNGIITTVENNYRKRRLSWSQSKRKFLHLYDLLSELIVRDIKLRYKRSVLGIAWSLLNPLVQLLVFNFIFSYILPLNVPNYTLFLFVGLLAWNWFQSSLLSATLVIVDNRELVRKPGFKSMILPLVVVSTNLIHYLLALPILMIFIYVNGINLTMALLALPLVLAIQFVFTLSLAYILSAVHVTFRDTHYLLGIALLLGFYLSPVFYPFSSVPEQYRVIYQLNPLAILIYSCRTILINGEMPRGDLLVYLGLASIFLLWLGLTIFNNRSYRFVEEL
jgi:lipopolysaccharide transport system permease protein